LAAAAALLPLCACAGGRQAAPPPQAAEKPCLVAGVPFFPQKPAQCGPACLAGVLGHWNRPVSPDAVSAQVFSRRAGGSSTLDMVLYAKKQGLYAALIQGTPEALAASCSMGVPLIVMCDVGFWNIHKSHFMVVVGSGPGGVVVNAGREPKKLVSWDRFLKSWDRAGNFTLWIAPFPPPPKGAEETIP